MAAIPPNTAGVNPANMAPAPDLQSAAQNILGQRSPAVAPPLAPGEIPHPGSQMETPPPAPVAATQQAHEDVSPFRQTGEYTPSVEAVSMMQKWLISRSAF